MNKDVRARLAAAAQRSAPLRPSRKEDTEGEGLQTPPSRSRSRSRSILLTFIVPLLMASMILRASRVASRATPSAASVANRSFPIALRYFGRRLASDHGDFPVGFGHDSTDPATPVGKSKPVPDTRDPMKKEMMWQEFKINYMASGGKLDEIELRRRFDKFLERSCLLY